MGEKQNQPFQLSFNASLKVEFQGSRVTSNGGLIVVRELDERLGLEKLIEEQLSDSRQGLNKQFTLADLLRQSVYSRLAGYEDLNDAERLAADPTFRLISSQRIWDRGAALTSTLHWFETELLTKEENLLGLMALNRETLGQAESLDSSERVVLDMDSSESPVHGEQEGSAYNGHFESVCYHPLFLFNSHGDCLAAKLRPGNVHSAEDWDELLLPEIERQQIAGVCSGGEFRCVEGRRGVRSASQRSKSEIPIGLPGKGLGCISMPIQVTQTKILEDTRPNLCAKEEKTMASLRSNWLRRSLQNSKIRFVLTVMGLALVVFHNVPRTVAQDSSGKQAGVKMLQTNFSEPARDVVLGDLPQVTGANPARRPDISEQRIPSSSPQFRALQQQMSEHGGEIPPGFVTMDPPKSILDISSPGNGILPDTVSPPTNAYFPPTTLAASGGCYNNGAYGNAVAATPQYLVQLTANCITIINPATGAVYSGFPKLLGAFWGVGTNFVWQPRAIYDSASNHFILAAYDYTANLLLLATSVTANPLGVWHVYYLTDPLGHCIYNPTLGQSLQESGDKLGAIYLGYDSYTCSSGGPYGGGFVTDIIRVIGKSKTYSGTLYNPFYYYNFTDTATGKQFNSIQPVNVVNAHDRPRAEILVATYALEYYASGGYNCYYGSTPPCNGVVLWSLTDQIPSKGRTPTLAGPVVIPTANNYGLGGVAQQPSGSSCGTSVFYTDTGTYSQVDYSSGLLYAAINTFSPSSFGSEVLSWQFAPQLDDGVGKVIGGTIRSETVLAFGGTGSALNPAIIPDSEGNYTMVYTYSDSSTPPTVAYLSNRVTQVPNTLSDSGFMVSLPITPAPYCPGGFAFLYQSAAGASTGVFPNSQWFSGPFSDNTGNWATAIGKTGYTTPAQP